MLLFGFVVVCVRWCWCVKNDVCACRCKFCCCLFSLIVLVAIVVDNGGGGGDGVVCPLLLLLVLRCLRCLCDWCLCWW